MLILAAVGIAALASFVILSLFAPGLRYKVMRAPALPLDSGSFCRTVESLCHSRIHRNCCIEVLTNGEVFYPAELEAIRRAERTVNLEAYIFQRGEVGERFVEALAERARAGVRVNVVLDAIGALMNA